ncbi:MAG: hypothetical protein ACYS9X_07965 [Planctomycetota bacterium]|jgi:hypothetical protein
MARLMASVVVGSLAFAAQAAAAGKAYDDREVMKRSSDLASAVNKAIPGPRQCESQSGAFARDPVKGHLAELRSIERTLRAAGRRDDNAEIRRLRTAVAGKTAAFVKTVTAYGASAVSYASIKRKVKTHEKTKPKC